SSSECNFSREWTFPHAEKRWIIGDQGLRVGFGSSAVVKQSSTFLASGRRRRVPSRYFYGGDFSAYRNP
ncbi:MAG: hypothetical protein ORN83_01330, partial [Chthoniobacteraceae bacterium]|nr:hypothetical protein [Chthoniobacteraceae bacterium]